MPTEISHIAEWEKKAAIVAHPYAPLGGCYDDPVVDVVASTILKAGFIVGTFNFRFVYLHAISAKLTCAKRSRIRAYDMVFEG